MLAVYLELLVLVFNIYRINSLKKKNCELQEQLDDVCKESDTKQTLFEDAKHRVLELEKQVETKNVEHTAYKEKARKVLQVSSIYG